MPWSDAPGLSAHALVVRSVGQEDGSPQWGVVHEHTRRPTPVFMNTHTKRIFTGRPGHMKTGHPHLRRQLSLKGRSIVGRYSTTVNPDFFSATPLFMNKQWRWLLSLLAAFSCRSTRESTIYQIIGGKWHRVVHLGRIIQKKKREPAKPPPKFGIGWWPGGIRRD